MSKPQNKLTSPKLKGFLRGISVFVAVFLIFVVASAGAFYLSTLVSTDFSDKGFRHAERFLRRVAADPLFLIDAYKQWFQVLAKSVASGKYKVAAFIPFSVPLIVLLALLAAFVKSRCSFNLWFWLYNRYAKAEDVEKMGLFNGRFLALGLFENRLLSLRKSLSVLCLGNTGRGKTASVAVPSVLYSDGVSLVAAGNSNELAKYTSGYRATLGPVFYFNWNLCDEPQKNEYYPRWNPLSAENMPHKGEEREKYLAAIAKYFIVNTTEKETDIYWQRLAMISLDGILNFFAAKIEQACANDYFLSVILEKGRLSKEDKEILLSYYVNLPKKYSEPAIKTLEAAKIETNEYMPVGSWEGVPAAWQGKEICFAMFSDWLLESYLTVKKENPSADGWRVLIERWVQEAEFFSYSEKAVKTLQHLYFLSRKQRSIIFPMLFKPLSVFRNSAVRERTSASDFCASSLRGIKNPQSGKWEVVTVYNVAGRKSVDFIGKFFIDMMIESNLAQPKGHFPLLFLIDDFENQPRFYSLIDGLIHGEQARMSFLLLSENLQRLQEKYDTDGLESIVSNTACKLVMADDSAKIGRQFENLAVYGTKSVQIPAEKTKVFMKVKQGLADADYYKVIARHLYHEHKSKLALGNRYLILSGFYHLPVRLQSLFFLHDDDLKNKAALSTCYFIGEDVLKRRNVQDEDVPELLTVLNEAGLEIDNEEDINMFIEDKYEEAVETRQVVSDKTAALADDISARWKKRETEPVASASQNDEDWWLDEGAFSFSINKNNPFDGQN